MDDHPNATDMLNKSQREAAYWRERCEAIVAAMRDAIASGYPWPREKVEQCEHGKFKWEDCIACYDDFLEARLDQFENITPESKT